MSAIIQMLSGTITIKNVVSLKEEISFMPKEADNLSQHVSTESYKIAYIVGGETAILQIIKKDFICIHLVP